MKLIIYTKPTEETYDPDLLREEYDVDSIDWWDQRYIGNGIWLHCFKDDHDFCISFKPENETFLILK